MAPPWLFLLLAACHPDDDRRPVYPNDDTGSSGGDNAGDDTAWDSGGGDTGEDCGDCPCGMVPVGDGPAFCVDRYEAVVDGELGRADQGRGYPDGSTTAVTEQVEGIRPTLHVTWYQAFAACENAGKRLCTVSEWQDACDGVVGEGGSTWPWGESPPPEEVCVAPAQNGTTEWSDVQPVGSRPDCHGPVGAYDMPGNAWEWADPGETAEDGGAVAAKLGGAWYAGYGALVCDAPPNLDHPADFEGDIGVRCCSDPR